MSFPTHDNDTVPLAVARAWSMAGGSDTPIPAVVRVRDDGFPLESLPPCGKVHIHFADGTVGLLPYATESTARSIRAHYGLSAANVKDDPDGNDGRWTDNNDDDDDDNDDHPRIPVPGERVIAHVRGRHLA